MAASFASQKDRLRVVVWNIASKARAWAALDRLEPDICLLNEAVVPKGRDGVWSDAGTLGRDGKTRRWSAAVISGSPSKPITDARPRFRQNRREVPFVASRPGSWVAASVNTPLGVVTSVALYGLMDELSDASVHRSLSELSPLVDDARYRSLIVVGGDLNTGTQWSKKDHVLNARDRNVLDRFTSWGLVDCVRAKRAPGRLEGCLCVEGDDCAHVRTRRDSHWPEVPYQTDYLFASPKLASALISCEVLATDEWFAISDHAPIVADFQIKERPTKK